MSVCRLMIEDFMISSGQYGDGVLGENGFNEGDILYDTYDLEKGRDYAQWLLEEEGYITEPFYGFDLKQFIKWCNIKLELSCLSATPV